MMSMAPGELKFVSASMGESDRWTEGQFRGDGCDRPEP